MQIRSFDAISLQADSRSLKKVSGDCDAKDDCSTDGNLVQSNLSVADYFAHKMAAMRSSKRNDLGERIMASCSNQLLYSLYEMK